MNRLAALSPPIVVPQADGLRRWTAWGLAASLAGAATLLSWRRLAGALGQPLDAASLTAVGVAWCCAAATVRWCCHPTARRAAPPVEYVGLFSVLSLATAAFGLSLSVPGTGGGPTAALWTLMAAFEIAAWRPAWRGVARQLRSPDARRAAPQAPAQPERLPEADRSEESPWDRMPESDALDAKRGEHVVQQWVRTELSDGRQALRGVLRVPLAAGQRSASAHVAFCPPFAHTPRVEAHSADGPAVRIKTAQAAPFGARLDLKLSEPARAPAVVELRIAVAADE